MLNFKEWIYKEFGNSGADPYDYTNAKDPLRLKQMGYRNALADAGSNTAASIGGVMRSAAEESGAKPGQLGQPGYLPSHYDQHGALGGNKSEIKLWLPNQEVYDEKGATWPDWKKRALNRLFQQMEAKGQKDVRVTYMNGDGAKVRLGGDNGQGQTLILVSLLRSPEAIKSMLNPLAQPPVPQTQPQPGNVK